MPQPNPFREALRASRPANPFRAALGEADRPPTPRPPTTSAAEARQQIAEPSSQAVLAQPEATTPAVAAPARQSDSWAELGRKVIENAPTLFKLSAGGLAMQAGAGGGTSPVPEVETADTPGGRLLAQMQERRRAGAEEPSPLF